MRLGIYGGTFNPPHQGHVGAANAAAHQLKLDRLLIVPAGSPPHKELPKGTPTAEERLVLAQLSFSGMSCVQVTDMEVLKAGASYTMQTIDVLLEENCGAEIFLIMGTDMFLSIEQWWEATRLLKTVTVAVLGRSAEEEKKNKDYSKQLQKKFNASIILLKNDIIDVSSTEIRDQLPCRRGCECLEAATYAYIIQNRLYGAKPDFAWLRARAYEMLKPKRIPHVVGCEEEAVHLAQRWGADVSEAREAAILHDVTKYLELSEQLQLCVKYDIMTDAVEAAEVKLLHAKTGAAIARYRFGASDAVHDAILWHTTGRANMTLLEKIIYIADYIEPTRDFEGVDRLRALAYDNLDQAVYAGLKMSIDDMIVRGITPHERTTAAIGWFSGYSLNDKEGS